MHRNTTARLALTTSLIGLLMAPAVTAASDPWGMLLTWQRDPTTTMTVQWLEPGDPLPLAEGQTEQAMAFEVPYVGDVTIDGSAAPWWARGMEIALLGDEHNRHPDPAELSAQGRIGWNEQGLVIALRVRDDTMLEFPEDHQLWAGDSIEVFLSDGVGSNHRLQALVTPGLDPNHAASRHAFFSFGSVPPAEELTVTSGTRPTEDGYEIEILLPWNNLPELEAQEGAELGLQVHVNDRSAPVEDGVQAGRQRVVWYPAADTWGNPESKHPVRLSRASTTAGRLRLAIAEDGDGIDIYAPQALVGQPITLVAGERELGVVELAEGERLARGRFEIPAPPEGRQWGAITAWHDDQLVAQILPPRRHEPPAAAEIVFWPAGAGEADAQRREMELRPITAWGGQFIQRIELTDLEPGTAYRFRTGANGREYGFRTMPAELTRPIRVAVGGDTRHDQQWMERTNGVAMQYKPDFIVWGGDLAYADGLESRLYRWEEWFTANDNTLIDDEGFIVPIVVGIGNHEVQRGSHHNHTGFEPTDAWRQRIAPYFYQLFAFPGQPGYATLDFADYLSLIILDSDHTNPVDGEQTQWLQRVLAERADVPHVIPIYHVPAFPSHRPFEGAISQRVRDHWVPLFERYNVAVAFENHDHTYKRTVPIREGRPHPGGIVYIGDGAWGVGTRTVHDPSETWYLEHAESTRHAIIMTLDGPHRHFLVVSEDGEVIDEHPRTPEWRQEPPSRDRRPGEQ